MPQRDLHDPPAVHHDGQKILGNASSTAGFGGAINRITTGASDIRDAHL